MRQKSGFWSIDKEWGRNNHPLWYFEFLILILIILLILIVQIMIRIKITIKKQGSYLILAPNYKTG